MGGHSRSPGEQSAPKSSPHTASNVTPDLRFTAREQAPREQAAIEMQVQEHPGRPRGIDALQR